MQIFQNKKIYKKNILIIILHVFSLFFITSCTFDRTENDIYTPIEMKKQFKILIVPKNISFPKKDKKYEIPYSQEELEKKQYTIFPPVQYKNIF